MAGFMRKLMKKTGMGNPVRKKPTGLKRLSRFVGRGIKKGIGGIGGMMGVE